MLHFALAAAFTLTPLSSGTTARLQAVSVAGDDVIWASGLEGTFVRSIDGGKTWTAAVVAESEDRQFRDVHAVDADTAYLMSSGPGDASRIYKTMDGGMSWSEQFVNDVPGAFYDCMDFWDADHGIAFSDSVDGEVMIIRTDDGETWQRIGSESLPPALEGEGGFAASGTCVRVLGASTAYIAMGVNSARVLRTRDRGASWDVVRTPVPHENETSGLTSVAFLDNGAGVAAGGDIAAPEVYEDTVAVSEDGGESWWLVAGPTFTGAVYGVAFVPGAPTLSFVAVGPGGASYSVDNGSTWSSISSDSYWSVGFAPSGVGFLVGPDGRLSRIELSF